MFYRVIESFFSMDGCYIKIGTLLELIYVIDYDDNKIAKCLVRFEEFNNIAGFNQSKQTFVSLDVFKFCTEIKD